MKPSAILFDTSDTLYHSEALEKEIKRAPIIFISEKRNINQTKAESLYNEAKKSQKSKQKPTTKSGILMSLGFKNSDWQNFLLSIDPNKHLSPNPNHVEALEKLSNLFKLGIITNINKKFLTKTLASIGLKENLFSILLTSDDVLNPKPNTEPFKKAIEILEFPANEIVYVGDNIDKDLEPARKSGMLTVYLSENSDNNSKYDYHITDLAQIYGLFHGK